MSNKKNIPEQDDEWGNIELPGLSDEELYSKNWNYTKTKKELVKIGRSIKQGHLKSGYTTLTDKIRKEIFYNSWCKDRGGKYIRDTAKKYGVKPASVKDWTGKNAAEKFGENYDALQKEWRYKYDPPYILRSPGNDLLDYYDEINELRHNNNKILLPPSVIYHYRFVEANWTTTEVKAKFPHIKPNTLFSLLRNRIDWLVDKPHTEYKFENLHQMTEWCQEKFGNGAAIREIADPRKGTAGMAWKGAMAGWTIIQDKGSIYE